MNSSRTLRLLKDAVSGGCAVNISRSSLPRGGYVVSLSHNAYAVKTTRLGFQDAIRTAVTSWIRSRRGRARRAKK